MTEPTDRELVDALDAGRYKRDDTGTIVSGCSQYLATRQALLLRLEQLRRRIAELEARIAVERQYQRDVGL